MLPWKNNFAKKVATELSTTKLLHKCFLYINMALSFFSFLFLIRIRLYEMQNRKRKETIKNKDRKAL